LSLVLDASMAVAWLFEEERTPTTEAAKQRVTREGAGVPSIWRLEVANVLRSAVRRGRCDESYASASLILLNRLMITVDGETDLRAWSDSRALSLAEGLTLYDASYLELAIRTGGTLASLDVDLVAAAGRRGVGVLTA
jgi:predicted nucleic acid-binding protein